jgi:hypothetical protein
MNLLFNNGKETLKFRNDLRLNLNINMREALRFFIRVLKLRTCVIYLSSNSVAIKFFFNKA